MKHILFILCFFLTAEVTMGQAARTVYPLRDTSGLVAYNVNVMPHTFKNRQSLKVVDMNPQTNTELRIVKLSDTTFHNGTIEVELAGEPMKQSPEGSRGFVGMAFRIDNALTKYECIYLRPTNGRADDQVRRNHSVQYVSYPDFPWYKLRKEFPEKYESYVDLESGQWTKVKIEVKGNTARLFVHGATQPTLIVSDLKHGEDLKGCLGLWIGPGTEAHFRNLVVKKDD